jgi:hypothetical protein
MDLIVFQFRIERIDGRGDVGDGLVAARLFWLPSNRTPVAHSIPINERPSVPLAALNFNSHRHVFTPINVPAQFVIALRRPVIFPPTKLGLAVFFGASPRRQ